MENYENNNQSNQNGWEHYTWNSQAGRWEQKADAAQAPAQSTPAYSTREGGQAGTAWEHSAGDAPKATPVPAAPAHSTWEQQWSAAGTQAAPHAPAQGTQSAQGTQGAQSWNGQWQNARQYTYTPAHGAQKAPRKKRGGLKVVAMLLACAVFGFGGGWAALALYQPNLKEPTVVYQTLPAGSGTASASSEDLSVSGIAEKASASVVAIITENTVMDYFSGGEVVSGAGSGVIISEDGTILTNHHVVDGAQSVSVTLPSGEEYKATVLGSDRQSDIAVLKIEATGLVPAVIGGGSLRVGDFVLAIGNPTGTLQGTVTEGIVSALDRHVTIDGVTMNLIQMSAAVSPGNSGGGLFNAAGELIGVVNAKSGGESTEGLGFAIPVTDAMTVAEEIIATGRVVRPGLGVSVLTVADEQQAAQVGVPGPGLYIQQVNAGSPAEKAGLQVGDRILNADGTQTDNHADLSSVISAKEVGDKIELLIERNGQKLQVTATLGELQA